MTTIELNNGCTIPQIGVGTWTLRDEVATNIMREVRDAVPGESRPDAFTLADEDMQSISALNQNLRSNVNNDPETFP